MPHLAPALKNMARGFRPKRASLGPMGLELLVLAFPSPGVVFLICIAGGPWA